MSMNLPAALSDLFSAATLVLGGKLELKKQKWVRYGAAGVKAVACAWYVLCQ
jgi:hypothetical protein